jgi:hypothetical protein
VVVPLATIFVEAELVPTPKLVPSKTSAEPLVRTFEPLRKVTPLAVPTANETFCEASTVIAVVDAVCSCNIPDVSADVTKPPDVAALIMLAMLNSF